MTTYILQTQSDYLKAWAYAQSRGGDEELYTAHLLVFNLLKSAQDFDKNIFNTIFCPPDLTVRRLIAENFSQENFYFKFPEK